MDKVQILILGCAAIFSMMALLRCSFALQDIVEQLKRIADTVEGKNG